MKAKFATVVGIGLLVCRLCPAQTPSAPTDPGATNSAAADPVATNPAAGDPVATNPAAANPVATNPIVADIAATNVVATNPTVVDLVATNPAAVDSVATNPATVDSTTTNSAVADTAATNPVATNPVGTNPTVATPMGVTPTGASTPVATAPPAPVIPYIQFQDVLLTAAIENLARLSGLNYILDPNVSFGQPDEQGKPHPQPTISLRWENISAEQALMALLNNYGLQLVENPKTKVARIAKKDPAALEPLVSQIYQLKYASVSNLVAAVHEMFTDKRSKVVPDVRTSQLIIVATEKEQTVATAMIKLLDAPTKQVLIEAKILETTLNPKTSKGIDWTSTLGKQNITFGNGLTRGTATTSDKSTTLTPGTPTTYIPKPGADPITITPASSSQTTLDTARSLTTELGNGGLSLNTLSGFSPHTAFLNADGLNVALSFLNSSDDTKLISEPRLVTLDNQKAQINVGLLFPIVNTAAGTANTSGGSQIAYSNLTVNLDVTPRIAADDFIELKVLQTILRLGPSVTSTVGGVNNVVNSFFTRKLETDVLIPGGNTLVLGGLISDESTSSDTKVPLMGDVPVFGGLFRKSGKERNRNNLIIFITPTVVTTNDFQPATTIFLKSSAKKELGATDGWSAWDSGKPSTWKMFEKKTAAPPSPEKGGTGPAQPGKTEE